MIPGGMEKVLASIVEDIDYSVDWRTADFRPGRHKSRAVGSGFEFKGVISITDADKPVSLAPIATAQAVDRIPRVRITEQKSALKVILVTDLSASLSYAGYISKREEMAKFAVILGYSAYRVGDAFGFVGYSDKIEIYEPPVFSKGAAFGVARQIWESNAGGRGHKAITEIAGYLPKEKSLIFWFSDFYFSEKEIEGFLASVGNHDVKAVSFIDSSEINFPKFGFTVLGDPELGGKRLVFVRSAVRKKIAETFIKKRSVLNLCSEVTAAVFILMSAKLMPKKYRTGF